MRSKAEDKEGKYKVQERLMRLKDKVKRRDSNWYRNIKMQIKNRELAEDFKEVFFV